MTPEARLSLVRLQISYEDFCCGKISAKRMLNNLLTTLNLDEVLAEVGSCQQVEASHHNSRIKEIWLSMTDSSRQIIWDEWSFQYKHYWSIYSTKVLGFILNFFGCLG